MEANPVFDIKYKNMSTEYKVHYHYNHEILYIARGECEMTVNGKKYNAKANDAVLICNLENHSTKVTKSPYERYVLMINPTEFSKSVLLPQLNAMFKQRSSGFKHCLNMENTKIKALFEKLIKEKQIKDAFSSELSSMYLKEILIEILRKHESNFQKELNKTHEIIMNAQSFIENNYAYDIKIDNLAEIFFLNKYYFSHSFKEFSGMSPKQYLTQIRLTNALRMLKSTDLSVSEITSECGFSDINNFIRIFKREFGCPPSKYRKSLL